MDSDADKHKAEKQDTDLDSTTNQSVEPVDAETQDSVGGRREKLPDDQPVTSALQMHAKRQYIQSISIQLLALLAIVSVFLYLLLAPWLELNRSPISSIPFVFLTGVTGGIIGIQSRLKTLAIEDLDLLAHSVPFLLLAPIIGGFLALLLFLMFIGGLIQGNLFPVFSTSAPVAVGENIKDSTCVSNGISSLMCVTGAATDYAKLLFWSFVAGFSERFVTGLMLGIESGSVTSRKLKAGEDVLTTAKEKIPR